MSPTDANQKILRSTSVMSLGTMASRILGFVRDMIFCQVFRTAVGGRCLCRGLSDSNLFRDIIGEGAANFVFVPVMMEYKKGTGRIGA